LSEFASADPFQNIQQDLENTKNFAINNIL